jgi:periplasmic protein TonB
VTRGLGTALVLSLLAHGGAVATVGALGAAWLVGPPPALFVDLVHPVVATSDRIVAADASTARLPTVRAARSAAPGGAVPISRAPSDVARAVDVSTAPTGGPVSEPDRPTSVTTEVPRLPAASDPPELRVVRTEPSSAGATGVHAPPGVPPAHSTPASAFPAAPAVAGSPASEAGMSLPRPRVPGPVAVAASSDPAGPSSSRAGGESAIPFGGRSTRDLDVVGSGSREQSGATGLARLVPAEAQPSDAPDGAIPPEYESYVRSLRQRIQERLAYPWTAVRRGQQGLVELEVRVGADGRLVAVEVVAGVNAGTLRTAAVAAVRGSAPFPFPPGLATRPLVIRLPVEFRLR